MKCPKCGSEVKPKYKFCSKCGQPMTTENPAPVVEQEVKESQPAGGNEKLFGIHFGSSNEEHKPRRQQSSYSSSDKKEEETPALVSEATNN